MPGYTVPLTLLKCKNCLDLDRYVCSKCALLLKDPVLPRCGHRLCKSCADGLPDASLRCPRRDCKKEFVQENGEVYQPDDSVQQEIRNLQVICPYFEAGCRWEGKFHEYYRHKENCDTQFDLPSYKKGNVRAFHSVASYSPLPPFADEQQADSLCCASAQLVELQDGKKLSEKQRCPVSSLSSQTESHMEDCYEHERHLHMQESDCNSSAEYSYLSMITNCRQLLKGEIFPVPASDHDIDRVVVMNAQDHVVPASDHDIDRVVVMNAQDHVVQQFQVPLQSENGVQVMQTSFTMQQLGDAVVSLTSRLVKVEEKIHLLNTKFKEHDFRLSLIESSNHDGTMVWKIPQFSQRKAEAIDGKRISVFSPPFYSGRYGYKMCLRLGIMGDGTGKGTHLSLFFVVMCGEFDNVLQWPFTHKVTIKLINQAGGTDFVNTFQPDPMSPSFKKPKSDMNVASGYPQFASLVELEWGGFVLDDAIFVQCTIDT